MKKFLAAVTAIILALSLVTVPVTAEKGALAPAPKTPVRDPAEVVYDFETNPFAEGWTAEDKDGDGFNWEWSAGGSLVDGDGFVGLISYDGDAGSLNPNNWLISPEVPGGEELCFKLAAVDGFDGDPVAVYVSGDGGESWSDELARFATQYGVIQTCEVDLSEYDGMNIKLAFRHCDICGQGTAMLDHVYVGPPVLPEQITVEAITVPVNRLTKVHYEVLPEGAFNKEVTFEIEDESIASVDADGWIKGISQGTTQITVTSAEDPNVSAAAAVNVTAAMPTVTLHGYIAADVNYVQEPSWCEFPDSDPENVTIGAQMSTVAAAAYAGGNVYGFLYAYTGNNEMATDFFVMDAETGEVNYPGMSAGCQMIAMAYDHAGGEMYALSLEGNYSNKLYKVNLAVGTLEYVAALDAQGNTIFTLAIDGEGNAYGLSYADGNFGGATSKLYSIDLSTGSCTVIGDTGLGLRFVQSTVWDHNTDQLFWAQFFGPENGLYTVNPQTAAVTLCGMIGIGDEIVGLWSANDEPTAPIGNSEFQISFVDGLTNEEIPGGYTVEPGTVLDPEDFPEPPIHEGYEFTGWTYYGAPVYADTIIKAKYRDPNAPMTTVILRVDKEWPDGSGYQMLIDADATAYGNEIPTYGWLCDGNAPYGLYEAFEYKIPENADGLTTTPNIVVNASISIDIPAGIYDWCITNPVPGQCIWIASDHGNINGRADDFEFIAGYTYEFHVYDSGMGDGVELTITDETCNPVPVPGTEPYEPPEVPEGGVGFFFETDPAPEDWLWEDHDGDGYNWNWLKLEGYNVPEGLGMMYSQSYINDTGAVTPDNWLISPEVPGGGSVSFMYVGQDPAYCAENFGVYVSEDGGASWSDELGYFTSTAEVQTGVVDLSAYEGKTLKIAFRHYNTIAQFMLNLDAVIVAPGEITEPTTEEPPTEEPPTEEPPTEEPPTAEPPTEEPPTEEPPTEEPPTEEPPTEMPTEPPEPPTTGFISLAGIGIAAILAGTGVVLFRRKRK